MTSGRNGTLQILYENGAHTFPGIVKHFNLRRILKIVSLPDEHNQVTVLAMRYDF